MRRTAGLLVALQVVFWTAYLGVKSTNFGGIDEWLVVDLASKGIVSFPYANRILSLLWVLPAHWLAPLSLEGYRLLAGAYVSLTGVLVFWLCRRLAPAHAPLAFSAGVFAMLWAPADAMRLSTVQGTVHLGFAFGTMLAITLLVESWTRRSRGLLAAAAAAALVTILSYEAVLPLLGSALLLLPWRKREARAWVLAWIGVVLLGAAVALFPSSGHSQEYQAYLGADPRPAWVAARLAGQYWLHLSPLVSRLPAPALIAPVPTLVVLATVLAAGDDSEDEAATPRRLAAAGVVGAGAAYAPYVLTGGVLGATRTQILSAPWIGVLLAAALVLLTRRLGSSSRRWAIALLSAWITFLGTSHVVRMQAAWDGFGRFPAQRSTLLQLLAKVPDVKPHTFVILVGQTRGAWPMALGFRHALAYFYEGRAAGAVAGADDRPYPARFGPSGIAVTPWPEIQGPWRQPATVYSYDEVIVAALSPSGSVDVLPEWPANVLPALPASATYQPFSRIVTGGPEIAARAVLR